MRLLARALIALSALLPMACSAAGDATEYKEGTHYKLVREAGRPGDGKRIQVAEFFWYGCGHCYAFEPVISAWAKTKASDVEFVQVPNSLGHPVGLVHAKAYYAQESLGLLPKTHQAMFDALNKERRPLSNDQQVAYYLNEVSGVMPDMLTNAINGFAVDQKVRAAEALAKQYGITSTPTVVVDGRYLVNATMAGGFPGMIKVIDFLTDKVRKERLKAKK